MRKALGSNPCVSILIVIWKSGILLAVVAAIKMTHARACAFAWRVRSWEEHGCNTNRGTNGEGAGKGVYLNLSNSKHAKTNNMAIEDWKEGEKEQEEEQRAAEERREQIDRKRLMAIKRRDKKHEEETRRLRQRIERNKEDAVKRGEVKRNREEEAEERSKAHRKAFDEEGNEGGNEAESEEEGERLEHRPQWNQEQGKDIGKEIGNGGKARNGQPDIKSKTKQDAKEHKLTASQARIIAGFGYTARSIPGCFHRRREHKLQSPDCNICWPYKCYGHTEMSKDKCDHFKHVNCNFPNDGTHILPISSQPTSSFTGTGGELQEGVGKATGRTGARGMRRGMETKGITMMDP